LHCSAQLVEDRSTYRNTVSGFRERPDFWKLQLGIKPPMKEVELVKYDDESDIQLHAMLYKMRIWSKPDIVQSSDPSIYIGKTLFTDIGPKDLMIVIGLAYKNIGNPIMTLADSRNPMTFLDA
jgi:hypothetical protein